jgi:hypothetical protein
MTKGQVNTSREAVESLCAYLELAGYPLCASVPVVDFCRPCDQGLSVLLHERGCHVMTNDLWRTAHYHADMRVRDDVDSLLADLPLVHVAVTSPPYDEASFLPILQHLVCRGPGRPDGAVLAFKIPASKLVPNAARRSLLEATGPNGVCFLQRRTRHNAATGAQADPMGGEVWVVYVRGSARPLPMGFSVNGHTFLGGE